VVDERNFDWRRWPQSFEDVRNGTAWRGAGQRFRLEAFPGTEVHRYMIRFQEPYLFNSPVSLGLSGYFFTRRYRHWDEERLGGRTSLGYQFTHDLSGTLALRAERIDISDPAIPTPPELAAALGESDAYGLQYTLGHDTRDSEFLPTEGHYLELGFEQVFGTFDYPRLTGEARQYFVLRERMDGSGRHVVSLSGRAGYSGSQTPLYDNFFAGGFSTMRGFDFRGASPSSLGVFVGGQFMLLGSVEYMFPITADDMLRAVVFCDFGTVEKTAGIDWDDFRVSPGLGLRIAIPALGPAPIAIDFAFPIASAETDDEEVFSFFVGYLR
jgi:outer membrane protein insertion porin family